MSAENVKLHHLANEAFNTRDVEAFVAYCDPEVELHSAVTVPGGGIYQGHDGVRRWHRELGDAFGGEINVEPEVFFDLGEYTITFHLLRGRGQHSGADVTSPAAHLCRWRDGLIVYFKGYLHREDVFGDLGIPKRSGTGPFPAACRSKTLRPTDPAWARRVSNPRPSGYETDPTSSPDAPSPGGASLHSVGTRNSVI